MSVDMAPAAVSHRLAEVGRMSDLAATRRMTTKVSMKPEDVSRRIARVSELRELCLALGQRGPLRPPAERPRAG